jgi:hypothetical protein
MNIKHEIKVFTAAYKILVCKCWGKLNWGDQYVGIRIVLKLLLGKR